MSLDPDQERTTDEVVDPVAERVVGAEGAGQIEAVRELRFDKLQLMFLDFPDTTGMEVFGDEVRPAFD